MWWNEPRLNEFPPLLPDNILDVATRAYAVVEVGGLSGYGPERGRNFEQLFYRVCARRGVHLCERAGSRLLAGQRSASGFAHEVDGATRAVDCITHWELKHLTAKLSKNALLIFNGKGLDFLHGSSRFMAKVPFRRFLLSGWDVGEESRCFAVLWGIALIEPGRFPLPLLYEAVAHNGACCLSGIEREAVRHELPWACRPLQDVLHELSMWSMGSSCDRCGSTASRYVRNILAIQEEIGTRVTDHLSEQHSDWVDQLANDTWYEVGGW